MTHTQHVLTVAAVGVSLAAAIATLAGLSSQARHFDLTWGGDAYALTPLPYVVLVVIALIFGRTVAGATISLTGAAVLATWGVYSFYSMEDAIGILLLPFALLGGCGLVLVAQLIRHGCCPKGAKRPI